MADTYRDNMGSVVFTGLVVCAVLALIVYLIG